MTAYIPRQTAVNKYGEDVVDYAVCMYETMPDKYFWRDLNDEERDDYFARAKYTVDKRKAMNDEAMVDANFGQPPLVNDKLTFAVAIKNIAKHCEYTIEAVGTLKGSKCIMLRMNILEPTYHVSVSMRNKKKTTQYFAHLDDAINHYNSIEL